MHTYVKNIAVHKELSDIKLGSISLQYTHHAHVRSKEKDIDITRTITVDNNSVVEIECSRMTNRITKYVVRVSHCVNYDKVLVLVPSRQYNQYKVLTVWLNHKNDKHNTLNLNRLAV